MKAQFIVSAAVLALGACNQNGAQGNAAADNLAVGDAGAGDPATGNLTMNSTSSETDQAINTTDNQSGLGNAADNAAASVGNSTD